MSSGRRRIAAIAVLPAAVALLAGVTAGLARLGLSLPGSGHLAGLEHGGLMVGGFVATVIATERAVSSPNPIALAVPTLSASGAVAILIGMPVEVAAVLFALSGTGLTVLLLTFLRRQLAAPLVVMTVGALCWIGGNIAWLTDHPMSAVLAWWIAFLVLTIAGERLELTRFQPPSRARSAVLALAVVLLVTGAAGGLIDAGAGIVLLGIAVVLMGGWLLSTDTARRTARRGGVATYAGVALLAAYTWLLVAGSMFILGGLGPGGWDYDATIHAFFLGFVFGAIFAHAPIIFPAITHIEVRFTALFYLPLLVLHTSLALRVASAPLESLALRQTGAVLNATALLLLAAAMLAGVIGARARRTGGDDGHRVPVRAGIMRTDA